MPDNDIQGLPTDPPADKETQEIIDEMKADGQIQKEEDQPKVDDTAPKADEATEKKEEAKADDSNIDLPEEKKDDPKPEKVKREAKYVPVGIHNEERHKRQEAEESAKAAKAEADALRAQLAEKTDTPAGTPNDLTSAVKSLTEKHGLEEGFVTDLLETAVKLTKRNTSGLTQEQIDDLNHVKTLRQDLEAKQQEIAQETGFSKEWESVIKEMPELADHKEALKEFAFSEGNSTTPLRRLAIEYLHDNPQKPGRKTAEAPGGGDAKAESRKVLDYENMTEDQLKKLEGQDLDAYFDWTDKKAGRRR